MAARLKGLFSKRSSTKLGKFVPTAAEASTAEKVLLEICEDGKPASSKRSLIKLNGQSIFCYDGAKAGRFVVRKAKPQKEKSPSLEFNLFKLETRTPAWMTESERVPDTSPNKIVLFNRKLLEKRVALDKEIILVTITFQSEPEERQWRSAIEKILTPDRAARVIQELWKARTFRLRFLRLVQYLVTRQRQLQIMERSARRCAVQNRLSDAAVTIQANWRRFKARREYRRRLTESRETCQEKAASMWMSFEDITIIYKKSSKKSRENERENLISSATFEKLVEVLLRATTTPDHLYVQIFLASYPMFTTTSQVMGIIQMAMPLGYSSVSERIAHLLIHWINLYPSDFRLSEPSRFYLSELIKRLETAELPTQDVQRLQSAAASIYRHPLRMQLNALDVPPVVILNPDPVRLEDIDDLEIARQLTLISSDFYRLISPREYCRTAWRRRGRERKAPHILQNLEHNKKVKKLTSDKGLTYIQTTSWVMQLILSTGRESGTHLIEKFITIASHCRNLNNWCDVYNIMNALTRNEILRLRTRWVDVSLPHLKEWESLKAAIDTDGNNNFLRNILKKAPAPCVPPIDLYLQDLIRLDDVPTKRGDMINFEKMEAFYDIVGQLKRFSQVEHKFMPTPAWRSLLMTDTILTDDEIYTKSIFIEPMRTSAPNSPVPSSPKGRSSPTMSRKTLEKKSSGRFLTVRLTASSPDLSRRSISMSSTFEAENYTSSLTLTPRAMTDTLRSPLHKSAGHELSY
ncbi:ras-specific guanine nucleotide-releasing factor 1-like [Planoprotostelium fungivorum]|uniref:Ras-specific guanine nucleotide-releasing factor 1-like n=1 Tax=Planoprotostelium fungivorum TaxID=1890364 RepID=A0A2P6P0T1_9EUKA|nr:ras-specific guanine nucleotide-releasing factor 1-like [Planoprotostelium fungivorum]